jgi:hypothetical protein
MENFDQILLTEEIEGIGLNTDILESGLINILVTCNFNLLLVKTLGSLLEENNDCSNDAEDRLNEAQNV